MPRRLGSVGEPAATDEDADRRQELARGERRVGCGDYPVLESLLASVVTGGAARSP